MGWSESIDNILVSRGARPHRAVAILLALVFLVDFIAAVFLREAPALVKDGANFTASHVSWEPRDIFQALRNFSTDTADIIALALIRAAILCFLCWLAIYVGTPKLEDLIGRDGGTDCSTTTCSSTGAAAPLLINAGPGATVAAAAAVCQPCGNNSANSSTHGASASRSAAAAGLVLSTDIKEEHLASQQRKERAELRKGIVCALMFLFTSGIQVYVGIKCIGFDQDWRARPSLRLVQTTIFLSALALINFESFLAKRLVMLCTREEGFLIPEFHPHRLYFNPVRMRCKCDLCRNTVKQSYNCKLCDFDVCAACFNKKDKATGEGIIRGDKGVKHVGALDFKTYATRGVRLILPELPMFGLAMSLLCANSLVRLFMPNYQGTIIQDIINAHHACVDEQYNISAHNATRGECAEHKASFLANVMMYGGLSFATSILSALRQLCFTVVARRVILHIRGRIFSSILDQDIAFFDGMRTGDLQQRTTSDVQRTASPIFSALPQLLSNVILLIGGIVMCFATSWRLSMLAFTTALPIMHVTRTYAEWSSKINRQIVQDFSDGNAIANEAITNVRTVRAVSSEDFERARYRETLNKGFAKGIKDASIGSLATFFNGGLDLFAGVLILWYGGAIAIEPDGEISVGNLITYQLYYNMMNNSIQALSGMLNQFTRAAGAAERVLSVIDLPPDIDPKAGAPVDAAVRAWSLRLEEVVFYYQMRPTNKVLDGLSFGVAEGTVCALVGTSGGGKSTVMHLLLRYYDPIDGSIALGGVDYRQLNFPSVHQRIGVVSQDTQMFNCSIGENITYGAPHDVSEAELEAAARAAQAWIFVSDFEDGMHTKVGERGQRLSGGQRQRIAIARCLLRKPKLLLLDEATSALDAESEAAVQQALDALIWTGEMADTTRASEPGTPHSPRAIDAGGTRPTVVLVAHRLSTVVNADKIVVVDKGKATEQGTHVALLGASGKYADLVKTQLQRQAEPLETTAGSSSHEGGGGAGGRGGASVSAAAGPGGAAGGAVAVSERVRMAPGEAAAAAGRRRGGRQRDGED